MKRFLFLLIMCIGFSAIVSAEIPMRDAKEVPDVGASLVPNYIVFPKEEPAGDHNVSNAPECDIKAVTAANDKKRLRIGIVLNNSITFKVQVVYGIKLIYSGGTEEWFVYNVLKKELMYIKKKNEKTEKTEVIVQKKDSDYAFITGQTFTDGKKIDNSVVTLLLDKDKHIDKTSIGKQLFLTVQVFSGYMKAENEEEIGDADETIQVKMRFIR